MSNTCTLESDPGYRAPGAVCPPCLCLTLCSTGIAVPVTYFTAHTSSLCDIWYVPVSQAFHFVWSDMTLAGLHRPGVASSFGENRPTAEAASTGLSVPHPLD